MSEKMREEFESWAGQNGYDYLHRGSVSGDYIGAATAIAWQAWQASRAALCVELPSVIVPDAPEDAVDDSWMDGPNGQMIMLGKCAKAIHAAGVSTK